MGARAGLLALLWLPVLAVLASCDQFSVDRVTQACVRDALKAGEPYGSQQERQQTEQQLRQYCRAAAEGK